MKKQTYILIISVVLILLFVLRSYWLKNMEDDRMRPSKLKSSAFYLGGTDGGVWVDFIFRSDTCLLYIIYDEYGTRIDTCEIIGASKENLLLKSKKITGYNGKEIIINGLPYKD